MEKKKNKLVLDVFTGFTLMSYNQAFFEQKTL